MHSKHGLFFYEGFKVDFEDDLLELLKKQEDLIVNYELQDSDGPEEFVKGLIKEYGEFFGKMPPARLYLPVNKKTGFSK